MLSFHEIVFNAEVFELWPALKTMFRRIFLLLYLIFQWDFGILMTITLVLGYSLRLDRYEFLTAKFNAFGPTIFLIAISVEESGLHFRSPIAEPRDLALATLGAFFPTLCVQLLSMNRLTFPQPTDDIKIEDFRRHIGVWTIFLFQYYMTALLYMKYKAILKDKEEDEEEKQLAEAYRGYLMEDTDEEEEEEDAVDDEEESGSSDESEESYIPDDPRHTPKQVPNPRRQPIPVIRLF
ncbi:unnamed protein product [Caenorhabditis auriculariae]|uniref:Uncharacterized protein n=1 Tax=Caenorhabditis auriculariae TaxID=2777116 RepID=A0A8S1HYJ2_9PELO|nr:unnamed protein product [Caenorhabditis auriculariae]